MEEVKTEEKPVEKPAGQALMEASRPWVDYLQSLRGSNNTHLAVIRAQESIWWALKAISEDKEPMVG